MTLSILFEKKFGRVPKRAVRALSVQKLDWQEKWQVTTWLFDWNIDERTEKEFRVGNVIIRGEIIEGRIPHIGYVTDIILKEFDFDAVKPAYKTIPHHVYYSDVEEEFEKLYKEAIDLAVEISELQKIDVRIRYLIRFYDNVPFNRGLAYLEILREYNREQVRKLRKVLSEVEEREKKVRELSKKLREVNKKLKELSRKAYRDYQKDIEEGTKAFYEGDFDKAAAYLGWDRFVKLAKEEFDLSWVKIVDARGPPWRAILAVKVTDSYNRYGERAILPTGRVFLMGLDDNEERWFIELQWDNGFPEELEYMYDLKIEAVEARIFDVSVSDIKNMLYDRQGDVLILRGYKVLFDKKFEEEAEEETELVIVSKHVLKSEKPFKYVEMGNKVKVLLEAPAVLEHPEHHNVELEPGRYVIAVANIPEVVD